MIKSIGEIPAAAAQVYGDKTVLVCEDRNLSFNQLNALSNKLATALIELGVQVGDRVTLYSPNCCLLYTSPSPRDATLSRMPSSA